MNCISPTDCFMFHIPRRTQEIPSGYRRGYAVYLLAETVAMITLAVDLSCPLGGKLLEDVNLLIPIPG